MAPAGDQEFDLFYVRTGRKSAHPLVVIPGGPGAASIALYRGFRRRAAAEGLDVIMVEHRGVGMSRHDDTGTDLPPEALTIDQVVDDVAAVLDDAQVDKAVIYGTSYGTYVAAGVGVRHPDRVHAMILDSPVLSADDIDAVRDATRGCCGTATSPRPLTWRQRCGSWWRGRCADARRPRSWPPAVYGFAGPDGAADASSTCCWQGRDGLWRRVGLGHQAAVRAQDAVPPRARPG